MKFHNQTKKKNSKINLTHSKKILYSILIILGAVLIFIAPLLHRIFPKKNPIVESYKKELSISVTELENKLVENRYNLENDLIGKDLYFKNLDKFNKLKEETLKKNNENLNSFIKEHRVFGWNTTRSFLVGFGVRLPYLLISIIVSFLVYKINTEERLLKKSLFWLQVSCYAISFYFMFWVFWTSKDFSVKAYRWFFILASILSAITTVYFISYFKLFQLKSSKIIGRLILLLFSNDKYMETKEKSDEYIKDTVKKIEEIIS